MSSLWTPGGEHQVPRSSPAAEGTSGTADQTRARPTESQTAQTSRQGDAGGPGDPSAEETAASLDELQREVAAAPAEAVIANHCYGLFELAALHLSQQPPQLSKARLAIDALACLVEGLEGRLGPDEGSIREGLSQIQVAFVRLQAAGRAGDGADQQEP
jgi:hypothetical protein